MALRIDLSTPESPQENNETCENYSQIALLIPKMQACLSTTRILLESQDHTYVKGYSDLRFNKTKKYFSAKDWLLATNYREQEKKKKEKTLDKKQQATVGYCFGLFILLSGFILVDKNPNSFFSLIKLFANSKISTIDELDEWANNFFTFIESAQWPECYSKNLFKQSNIKELLSALFNITISQEKILKNKINTEIFLRKLKSLKEGEIMGVWNITPEGQPRHIIGIYLNGKNFCIHDSNYPKCEPIRIPIEKPDQVHARAIECLYTLLKQPLPHPTQIFETTTIQRKNTPHNQYARLPTFLANKKEERKTSPKNISEYVIKRLAARSGHR